MIQNAHLPILWQSEDFQGYPGDHLPGREGASVPKECSLDSQSKKESLQLPTHSKEGQLNGGLWQAPFIP